MRKLSFIVLFLCMIQSMWAETDHDILYDWQNYNSMRESDLYAIAVNDNKIYLGATYGLITIDKATGEQSLMNRVDGLTDNYISCLNLIGDELWYGGHKNGFGMIKDGCISNTTRSMAPIASTAWISVLKKDDKGNLWIASLGCLYKFVQGEYVEKYPFPNIYTSSFITINDILFEDENVWVSGYSSPGMKGLGKLTSKGIEMVYENLGTGANIIKDKHGNKWMAADKGLLKFNNGSFTEYRTDANGESLGRLACLTEDKNGKIWAVRDSFLIEYDGESMSFHNAHYRLQYMVLHNDVFYITAGHHGVLKFEGGKFQLIALQKFAGQLPSTEMTHAGSLDHEGNYLAGTSSGAGILKMKPDGSYTITDFFKGYYITKTVSDQNGDIWVACNWTPPFRLYKITPTDTITYNFDGSCPLKGGEGEEIFQMAVDHQNRLWIASSNGLHCFNGSNWQTFNKDNSGLTTNRVYCVAFDKEGRLWTSCGNNKADYLEIGDGLFCYDGKAWLHYVSEYEDVSGFANKDNTLKMPIRTNSIGYIAIDDNNTFWMAINYNDVYYTTDVDAWHGGVIRWDGKDDWQQFMSPYNGEADPSAATYTTGEWIKHIDFVLPGNWVNSIDFDRYGRVWIGFEGDHGIAMYDGKDFTIWDMDVPGIALGNTCNLLIDNVHDRIWVSHPMGINGGSVSTALIRHDSTNGIHPQISPSLHHQQTSTNVYDLSGRQILQPKRGELFIKDRKKYIKR